MTARTRSAVAQAALSAVVFGAVAYTRAQSAATSSAGQLRQVAYLKASNPVEDAHFGCGGTLTGHAGNASAISADGSTLAIGAPHENSGAKGINGDQKNQSAEDTGAIYFFTRKGTTWTQTAYVKASNADSYDEFGSAMALSKDGKLMAVGARGEASAAKGINGNQNDNSALGAGAVYIFSYR